MTSLMAGGIEGAIPYETIQVTLAAGEIRAVPKSAAYISVLSATDGLSVLVSFNGAAFFNLPPGIALSDFYVPEFWFQNSSGAPNTIVIATGMATLRDNRIVFDVTSPLPVTLPANQSINLAQVAATNTVTGGVAGLLGVGGSAAHSAAATGNPVRSGSTVRTTVDTTLVAGDASADIATDGGAKVTKPYAIPQADWSYAPPAGGIVNSAAGVTAKASAGAGLRNYVTSLHLSSEALTNATEFVIRDGAGGTVLYRCKIPAATVVLPFSIYFPNPLRGSAATLLEIQTLTASGAGGTFANLTGYEAP